MQKDFLALFGKKAEEAFVSVDIGASTIKLMEIVVEEGTPRLKAVGLTPTPANCVNNNIVSNPRQVGAAIRSVIDANDIKAKKAVVSVPGPSVFTKRINMPYTPVDSLSEVMTFEANNYIPQSIGPVHMDFQVLGKQGDNGMEVLLVAVRDEIILSYVGALEQAGLEPAIADVDYFALENMFQLNYPEEKDKTVALVSIGSRYASINIIQKGVSLFTGDVAVGSRFYTDALFEALNMKPADAEKAKQGQAIDGFDPMAVAEVMERTTDHIASELHRQIGFFWNAAATDASIDSIYVCGGGARMKGLLDELSSRTGMVVHPLDPFRGLTVSENFEKSYLSEIAPMMGVSVGLAIRRFGDKVHAIQ